MDFTESIAKSIAKIENQVNESITEIATELFTKVVDKTPVDSGRMKNNWYVAFNSYSDESNNESKHPSGSASLTRIAKIKTSNMFLNKDGFVSLSNSSRGNPPSKNYPEGFFYPYLVEYIGWKHKPPYRTMAISLMEINAKYKII